MKKKIRREKVGCNIYKTGTYNRKLRSEYLAFFEILSNIDCGVFLVFSVALSAYILSLCLPKGQAISEADYNMLISSKK